MKVLAVVADLFVGVRIAEAGKGIGASNETVASAEAAMERIATHDVHVIVVDLAMAGLDMEALATAARERGVAIVGFYPHVDAALRRDAKAAGIEHVYARSRFLQETAAILQEMV